MLLVNLGGDPEHGRITAKAGGYRLPILLDPVGEARGIYVVIGTPTVFLITRNGLIAGRAIGLRDWSGAPGRAALEAPLAGEQW